MAMVFMILEGALCGLLVDDLGEHDVGKCLIREVSHGVRIELKTSSKEIEAMSHQARG